MTGLEKETIRMGDGEDLGSFGLALLFSSHFGISVTEAAGGTSLNILLHKHQPLWPIYPRNCLSPPIYLSTLS